MIKKGPALRRLTKGILPFLVVIGALDILVMLEPDVSTAMMFTLVMGIILFSGGVRIGHFVALGVMLIPLLYVKVERLNYVLLRMSAFFDPGAAPLEVHVSTPSVVDRGWVGTDLWCRLRAGDASNTGSCRSATTISSPPISARNGDSSGLVLIVLAFAVYGALGFRIARKARTPFLQLVAVGLTVTMVLTAYLHIGVATGLLPTTGLTLPFISYGRSNLVLSLLMTGILVNIGSSRERVFGEQRRIRSLCAARPAR